MREQLLLSHFCNKRPISVYREGGIKKKEKIQDMKFSNYGTLKNIWWDFIYSWNAILLEKSDFHNIVLFIFYNILYFLDSFKLTKKLSKKCGVLIYSTPYTPMHTHIHTYSFPIINLSH